jgi:penicillin-insensitive murein endopeptidase
MRRALISSAIFLFAASAHATAPRYATHDAAAQIIPMGRSVGSPTAGRIIGGAHLESAPYLRVMPADQAGDVRWGLGSLVGMVQRAAQKVRHAFPGAVLNVGHLSKHDGGNIEQHASHESGRDVDLPFYVEDTRGRQLFAEHMVSFRGDGTAPTWPGAKFDDAKNWSLVAAVLEDPAARVTHIFVSSPLRQRLLAFAAHAGVAEDLRTRAAFAMVQPHGSLPHDDHFHVRIACPSGQITGTGTGCIENPAFHIARRGHVHGHAQRTDARVSTIPARSQSQNQPQPQPQEQEHGAEPRSREEVVADPAAAMVETIDGDASE